MAIKPIKDLLIPEFLEQLNPLDVYYSGYLMGQEESIKNDTAVKSEKVEQTIFSYESASYTTYRPQYPQALFNYLKQCVKSPEIILDCGEGSGQATLGFAKIFKKILALDASYELLSKSPKLPNVFYVQSSAEKLPFPDHSIGLVCVAQAVHWFKLDAFYAEVQRVLKLNGIIAVWCYNQTIITPEMDAIVSTVYDKIQTKENYSAARQYVYDEYKTLPFPFKKMATPAFEIQAEWNFHQWLGYMKTWPSILEYQKRLNVDLVENTKSSMLEAWGAPHLRKIITWPIYLLVGRVTS